MINTELIYYWMKNVVDNGYKWVVTSGQKEKKGKAILKMCYRDQTAHSNSEVNMAKFILNLRREF